MISKFQGVAVPEFQSRGDSGSVQAATVETAEIVNPEAVILMANHGMSTGHSLIVDENLAVGISPEYRHLGQIGSSVSPDFYESSFHSGRLNTNFPLQSSSETGDIGLFTLKRPKITLVKHR